MSSPSGPGEESNRSPAGTGFGVRLLVCRDCGSTLMYPASCTEHGRSRWYVELRCPDCGGVRASVFDVGMLDALDRELDRSEAALEAELARLTDANMLDYANRSCPR